MNWLYLKTQLSRVFMAGPYLITPLMVVSISWFSNHIEKAISTNTLNTVLLWSGVTLLLFISYKMFVDMVLANLRQRDPTTQASFKLILQITGFFAVTMAMGTLITFFANQLEGATKSWVDEKNFAWVVVGLHVLLMVIHFATDPDKGKRRKNRLFGTAAALIVIYLCVLYLAASTELIKWTNIAGLFLLNVVYSCYLFYNITRKFVRPYNRMVTEDKVGMKEHLILFLSTLTSDGGAKSSDSGKGDGLKAPDSNAINDLFLAKSSENIQRQTGLTATQKAQFYNAFFAQYKANDTVSLTLAQLALRLNSAINTNWTMPLLAIAHHLGEQPGQSRQLKKITMVVSKHAEQDDGSVKSVEAFLEGVNCYFSKHNIAIDCKVLLVSQNNKGKVEKADLVNGEEVSQKLKQGMEGVNFLSYEDNSDVLFELLNLAEVLSVGHSNTVIDVTGGTKPVSVACALAATVTEVENQYIDTQAVKIAYDNKMPFAQPLACVKGYDFRFVDPTKGA